jgi:hypothetical protein
LLFACKKENVAGPAGPPGPDGLNGDSVLSGKIYGRVLLYDTLGKSMGDNSNVSVSVNTSPFLQFTSNQDGSFTSPSFSSGVYNLSFDKAGFGTMKVFNFQHTGGPNFSQTGIIEMGEKLSSWFDIKNFQADTVNDNSYRYINVTITLAHPQHLPYTWIVFYFKHSTGIGISSNDFTFRTVAYQLNDSTLVAQYDYDFTEFTDKLNQSTIYMAAAIDNPKSFFYIDSLANTIYPAAGNISGEAPVNNIFKQ